MKFNILINSILKEEELSRLDKIKALKSMPQGRTFEIEYQAYERHNSPPPQWFTVQGNTLWDALQLLPSYVFQDIFNLSENDLKSLELDEDALKEYLNEIDFGGWPFLSVYENEELLCGIPEDEEGYEDEEGGFLNGAEE